MRVANELTGIRCIPGYVLLGNNTTHAFRDMLSDPTVYNISRYQHIVHISCVVIVLLSRTLWGANFGECTTCRENGEPAWTCPASVSAYADIGGSGADILELDGGSGKRQRVSLDDTYGKANVDETWHERILQQNALRRGVFGEFYMVASNSPIGLQLSG